MKARRLWGKKVVLSEKGDKLPGNKALEEHGENRKIGDGLIGGGVRD